MPALAVQRPTSVKARQAAPSPRPMRPRGWLTAPPALGNQARLRCLTATAPRLQAKLRVGAADHPLEREADAVADQVMGMAEPEIALSSAPAGLARKCAACEDEDKHGGDKPLARKAAPSAPPSPGSAPQAVHEVLGGAGAPLDAGARAFFEPRFGADFSAVRVHAGPKAAASAAAVNASAYTVGSHIVLAGAADRRLMAHELAHVVQQSGGAEPALRRDTPKSRGGPLDVEPGLCVDAPVFGHVCSNDAAKACRAMPGLPGCGPICAFYGCDKPTAPKTLCPPHFKVGTSTEHFGECCPEGNAMEDEHCCPPDRIPRNGLLCCAQGEVVMGDKCVRSQDIPPLGSLCDPVQMTASGQCCVPPLISDGLKCVFPPTPQTPPTKPPATSATPDALILFQQDHPAPGERDQSKVLTPAGAAALASVVAQLKASPSTQARLIGHASSEGATDYNQALAARRVAFVVAALGGGGRYADPPVSDGAETGCAQIAAGEWSCGETKADKKIAVPEDRNVQVTFLAAQAPPGGGAQGSQGGAP